MTSQSRSKNVLDAPQPSAAAPAKKAKTPTKSRAVVRDVEAGSSVDCLHCGERVKFQAKVRHKQVICNVYQKNRWIRVEHYHLDCYTSAGEPHGPAEAGTDHRRAAANAAAAERARVIAEMSKKTA